MLGNLASIMIVVGCCLLLLGGSWPKLNSLRKFQNFFISNKIEFMLLSKQKLEQKLKAINLNNICICKKANRM